MVQVLLDTPAIAKAREIQPPPTPGEAFSVPVPGSKLEGRSHVYRHFKFVDGLLETLDPAVCGEQFCCKWLQVLI